MALTNEQITAQNFKDFYGQIRPYLNGQVPTFANAFSRSDLYSTDEKIIGCWTDGKPIYQRTYQFSNRLEVSSTTWTDSTISASGMDRVLNAIGYTVGATSNDKAVYPLMANCEHTYVQFLACRDGSHVYCGYVTIQYTKTNDTPIKVGTGNDYSTDEQIVGTWIDGKPLYQKTMVGKVTVLGGWNDILHNISNIDVINVKEAFIKSGQNYWKVGGYATSNAFSLGLSDSTKIRIYVSDNETYSNADIYATINYTKTT